MKYTKPPKTFEEQADLLIERGLIADRERLIKKLRNINYYRLSGYLFPFKEKDEKFKENTTFEKVWRIYNFDRKLRLLIFDAIERIEVKSRTLAAYHIAHRNGPFDYKDESLFPRLKVDHEKWIENLTNEYKRSQEVFKKHFENKYGDSHSLPPVWIAVEIMSFGDIVRIFRSYNANLSKDFSDEIGVPDRVLESWLLSLNYIRNICAHHSRLWNRELSIKPLLPNSRKYKDWDFIDYNAQSRIFVIIFICSFLLKHLSPNSKWNKRLLDLFNEYNDVPVSEMGFPKNWKSYFSKES